MRRYEQTQEFNLNANIRMLSAMTSSLLLSQCFVDSILVLTFSISILVAICSFIDSRSAFVASGATAAMIVLAMASDWERVMPDSSSLCVAGRYA